MYLDYFGLRQKPFLITPDPAFIYPSQSHQQALAHLRYGLDREGGFVLLTGEVGTGKTTLCRLLIEELPENVRLAYILNTKLDSAGVLSGICKELGIAIDNNGDVNGLVSAIYDNLLQTHSAGQQTLVVIEEAQNLSPDVLETLRLLTNLETSATKLLHILLIGQPELLETLAQPSLRQLNQRVVSRCHLGPLSQAELQRYMPHRIKMAGSTRPLFTPAAIKLVHRKTGGIPRLVNLLAEHCLMGAYGQGQERVTAKIVRQGAKELFATMAPGAKSRPAWWWLAGAALLTVLGAFGFNNVWHPWQEPEAAPAKQVPVPVSPTVAGAAIAPAPALPGVFSRLLQTWAVAGDASSLEEACGLAASQGLRCEALQLDDERALAAVNRPLLVSLANGQDGLDYFLLTALESHTATLANSQGEQQLPVAELLARQRGEAVYLWRPPEGYERPLMPGESNPALVDLLVSALGERGYVTESLVTGGLYNDYLATLVETFQRDQGLDVDGIVGINTLLALAGDDEPRLKAR